MEKFDKKLFVFYKLNMVHKASIGLFGWIFNQEGKLLVKRRTSEESFPGDWDLPGGGVEEKASKEAKDERIVINELLREVEEETGLVFPRFTVMPAMFPAVIAGGSDWAFGIEIGRTGALPTKGSWRFISVKDLEDLTKGPVGDRLLSGPGKRMHRLCLAGFSQGPNLEYLEEAREKLHKIWNSW